MKKTHKVLLVLVGIIVLTVAGFKAMQPKEPEYQGRKLSEWMAMVSLNPNVINPAANEALYAMRHEALPIIERNLLNLEHIGKAPDWKKRIWDWQIKYKIGAKHTWWHHYDSNLGALRVLGTNAIPTLKRLAEDSHTVMSASTGWSKCMHWMRLWICSRMGMSRQGGRPLSISNGL